MRRPKYRRHTSRDFAFVEWRGQRHRLPGRWNSPESRQAYQRFIDRNILSPEPVPAVASQPQGEPTTISTLAVQYLRWARQHYPGNPSRNEYSNIKHAVDPLVKQCGLVPVESFGPVKLKQLRETLERGANARQYINSQIARIRRMFRWGVSEEMVPVSVWQALCAVPGLRRGHTKAREAPKRKPVPWEHVAAVFAHLHPLVASMLWLQWYTGARSSSVCRAKPEQFELGFPLWLWRPRHKTEGRDVELILPIGQRCQHVLMPLLARTAPGEYLFNPRAIRNDRRYNTRYSALTYRQAIKRGQTRAGVPEWTPHQLRHTRGTLVRERYGVEGAQAYLGHGTLDATQIYSRNQLERAKQIAEDLG